MYSLEVSLEQVCWWWLSQKSVCLQACSVPLVLVQWFCCRHKSGLATVICSHHLVYIIPVSSGFHCCWVDFCYSNYLSFLCRWSVLFLAAFKIFSLSLMFCSFTTMCLGMDSFYYSFWYILNKIFYLKWNILHYEIHAYTGKFGKRNYNTCW